MLAQPGQQRAASKHLVLGTASFADQSTPTGLWTTILNPHLGHYGHHHPVFLGARSDHIWALLYLYLEWI